MLTRIGACPTGCGKCCEWLELEVHPLYASHADTRHWVELHGITLHEREKRVYAQIPVPCTALTEDKRCALHGTPERPLLCSIWPVRPEDLRHPQLDGCVLEFVEAVGAAV